jgi:hypothetical protein
VTVAIAAVAFGQARAQRNTLKLDEEMVSATAGNRIIAYLIVSIFFGIV